MNFLTAFKRGIKMIFPMLLIIPCILTFYFGGVYRSDYVKGIPLAILDEDNSSASRLITTYFTENEKFGTACYPASREELEELINSGKAQLGVYFPKGFGTDVSTFQGSTVLVFADGTNMVAANNAYAAASTIVQTAGAGIEMKLLQGKGVLPETAKNIALVFQLGERILYDPKMTYMNYLMPCFLAVFIQQIVLSSLSSIFVTDRDYMLQRGGMAAKLAGILCAGVLSVLPSFLVSLAVLHFFYQVPVAGSVLSGLLMTAVFVPALLAPSMIIAAFTKDKIKYLQISFMLSLPTFVSSGSVWPIWQMPAPIATMIKLLWPLAGYAKPLQEILIKGRSIASLLPQIGEIVLYAAVWIPVAVFLYTRETRVNKTQSQSNSLSY